MEETTGQATDPMDALVSKLEEGADDDDLDEAPEVDEPEAEGEEPDAEPEEDEPEEEGEEEAPAGRYKVTVTDDSGEIVEKQVTFDELKAGYQRSRDVEVVRAQAHEQVQKTTTEAREYVAKVHQNTQAELQTLTTLVNQALGVFSPEDLLSLAHSDPSAYHQASAKQAVLKDIVSRIKAAQEQNGNQLSEAEQHRTVQRMDTSRRELAKAGITSAQVQKIYDSAGATYGFSPQELAANPDHRLVMLLKDAAEMKAIRDKKPQVQNKVREAPKPPPARKNAQIESQKLMGRLSKRGASMDDLAALLERRG